MSAAATLEAATVEVREALDTLERITDLAHRVLKNGRLSEEERERALMQLLDAAKRSRTPSLAAEAILRQVDASIDGTLHEPPRPIGDGWARRQRVLRALGYATCPACGGSIADEATVRRLERGWSE
jgi:hypothetical protein